MKITLLLLLFCLSMTASRSQSVVTILPDRPTLGDTITIIYNPNANGAKLKNKMLISLILVPYARPSVWAAVTFLRTYDMQLENNVWKKTLVWTDLTKPFFKYSFSSSRGDSSEADERDEFQLLLYDKTGRPLPNAHLCRYYALMDLKSPDADSVRHNELLEEVRIHPTNFRAYYVLWSNQLVKSTDRSETSTAIRRTVDSVFHKYPDNLDALVGCANVYRELGDTVKAGELEFRLLSLFPLSSDAEILKIRAASQEKIAERKIAILCDLLRIFPNSEQASRALSLIEDYYMSKQDSSTPREIKSEWERIRSGDINKSNFSLEEVRKTIQKSGETQAPDFVLHDLNGHKITSKELRGKILVLDFWATWCKPCKESFPQFQRIYEQYKANDKVIFLAINVNDSGDSSKNVSKFIWENGYSFPVALDTSKVTNQFSITAIPTTIVIDSQGNIRFRTTGYMTPDEYVATIKEAIGTLLQP